MNVIFCHAGKPHPKAEASVRAYAPDALTIDTGTSDFRYWEVLGSFWKGEEDLVTIEQDIEINPGTIESFSECSDIWCSYRYLAMRGWVLDSSLGCSKFSAEIQRLVPFDEMSNYTLTQWAGQKIPCSPQINWRFCDYRIFSHLKYRGYLPHVHGTVKHYHPYPLGAINSMVQEAIEDYLLFPTDELLDKVQDALDFAKTGEVNVNLAKDFNADQ